MQVIEYQNVPSYVRTRCIVGSSNGLLCLGSKYFILWNPATREILHVPKVKLRCTELCFMGFGFSPIVNDYKIVRLSLSLSSAGLDYQISLVQVFSLSTRSWKEVEAGKLNGTTPSGSTYGFTFDGAIFWYGYSYKLDEMKLEREFCLISFDIATESFALIPIPRHVSDFSRLTVFDNKLAMLCDSGRYISSIESSKTFSINLWVMEKCGERWVWTNIYESTPYIRSACFSSLLTIWRNQLFWQPCASPLFIGKAKGRVDKIENRLVLCNLHTNELKMLAIGKYPIGTEIWSYAESLVSPGNIQMEACSS